jgi:hypothetical protein
MKLESLEAECVRIRVTLEADPAALARCTWGLVFAIGALSFDDAAADLDLAESDEWTAGDMLRHLSFERGWLRFQADHVRGRRMKTTIEIDPDGRITLGAVDRGDAALRWLSRLQVKQATQEEEEEEEEWLEPIPF